MPRKFFEDNSDTSSLDSDEYYFDDVIDIDIDGDYEIEEYSDEYEPFEHFFKSSPRRTFAPRPVQIVGEYASTLSDVFETKMTVFKLPANFPKESCLKFTGCITRLCRSMLMNQTCSFGKQCKFAHTFSNISKCKFDYCKKTKLIGNGVFRNISNYPCTLRHNLETLDSFIFRNKEFTSLPIKLEIYDQFLDEFKEIIQNTKFSKLEICVV
jgi:hypothetical protein